MWVDSQSDTEQSTVQKSDGGAGQLDEIKAMLELIVTQNKSGLLMQSAPQPSTGKTLGGFKALAPPVDEDDDLPAITTKVSANAGMEANRNFMQGLGAL